ncbi:coiled-coil domain-containing protein 137-like [Clytia hemisphaerica]|uniref:Uncharacterized protein n=1 Tax=Clytia hemisphaerica TaxID=252671 RepID=A0A7M5V2L4_9CNID|eukprot:TCONS_00057515-protein
MGRMRRLRKLKSCDPFNKQNINASRDKVNDKYDKPPSKAELKDDNFGDSVTEFQRFQQFVELGASKQNIKNKKKSVSSVTEKKSKGKAKEKISKVVENCQQQPGETKKDMFRRLDQNIHNAMTEAIKEEKVVRKKRKEHLKARDEKRKNKGKQVNQTSSDGMKDFSSLSDKVKFGERVDEPPTITSAPRKASLKTQPKTLQLHSLFNKADNDEKEPPTKSDTSSKTTTKKRRREMNEKEKASFDNERQKAIDAYRLAKKRREMKNT